MKTIIIFLVAFFAFSTVCDSFAQEDSKNKKKNKNKDKSKITITVDSKEFPKSLEPSGSFDFTVVVENKDKDSEWSVNSLTFENESNFNIVMLAGGKPVLSPGESETYRFGATAPGTEGKEKLKVTFFNDGKKKRQIVKNIKLGTGESINESSDDEIREDPEDEIKNDDKNKNKENEENKEKVKEKNKNQNESEDVEQEKNKNKNNESEDTGKDKGKKKESDEKDKGKKK